MLCIITKFIGSVLLWSWPKQKEKVNIYLVLQTLEIILDVLQDEIKTLEVPG